MRVSNELSRRHAILETLLVAAILCMSALIWFYRLEKLLLLHLYYLPCVLAGFYLGRYRAGLLALLSVLGAVVAVIPAFQEPISGSALATLLAFLLWACTLGLTALMVGSLSDGWRVALEELRKSHKDDVLVDPLTRVANRRAFEQELKMRLAVWKRHQTPLTLMLVDIDSFKSFNDRHGHQAGDLALREIAQLMEQALRETDMVARYGGEEFGVILSNVGVGPAKEAAERTRSLVESTQLHYNGLRLRCTVSVGVAQINVGEDANSLIQRADAALYSSKEAGRNCAHFHNGNSCERFGNGVAVPSFETVGASESEKAQNDAYADMSTGLPTRIVFLDELRRRAAETARYDTHLSVVLVSVDDFQNMGHHDARAAKHLISTIARLIRSVMRDTELIARYDESTFSVLLPATTMDNALVPLERLRESAAGYSDVQYQTVSFAVSIGVAQLSSGEQPGSVLGRAESALESAVAAGRSCICYHDGEGCNLPTTAGLVEQTG